MDVFEAIGAHAAGKITDQDLLDIENAASPGAGACGGQYTANTMAMAFEVLGISPVGFSMIPAVVGEKSDAAEKAGEIVMDVLRRGVRPSDVITKEALANAIAAIAMSGGSTNGVLHLLAVASENCRSTTSTRSAGARRCSATWSRSAAMWRPTCGRPAAYRCSSAACARRAC
jgi:dihydroxy-acid dehydratase